MSIINRPAPPKFIDPPAQLDSQFLAWDWFRNEGNPSGESNHGLFVQDVRAATGEDLIFSVQQRSGVLLWAGIAAKNRSITVAMKSRLRISVDGVDITDATNMTIPNASGGILQSCMVYVGKIQLQWSNQSLIGGAEGDYQPFDDALEIYAFKDLSTANGGDALVFWDYALT